MTAMYFPWLAVAVAVQNINIKLKNIVVQVTHLKLRPPYQKTVSFGDRRGEVSGF